MYRYGDFGQLVIDKVDKILAQLIQIDSAGPEHGDSILIIRQGHQQVFKRRVLMASFRRHGQGSV